MYKQCGLTLLELLASLALAGIIIGFAVPSWRVSVAKSQVDNARERLSQALRYARVHALISGMPISLCPVQAKPVMKCQGSWQSHAWLSFIDSNANGKLDKADKPLRLFPPAKSTVGLIFRGFSRTHSITFQSLGQTAQNGRFTLQQAQVSKSLIINRMGRVRKDQ